MRFRILLACLILSGFSGLAYELLWTRLLALTFGSTSLSFSTVLAVFFGGLALGSWAAGRRAAKLKRPIRVYGLIEIVTGLFGLLLYPVIKHLDAVFIAMDPGVGLGGALMRFAFAAPILIVPTFLMGATLPVICAAMIYRDEDSGRGMALIYGFNTLGAFLGAYAVTYHLIPSLGVFRSLLVTVAANLVVGGIAFAVDRRHHPAVSTVGGEPSAVPAPTAEAESPSATEQGEPVTRDAEALKVLRIASGLTFFTGFAIIAFEVICARLFSSLLQGTIYGVGAVLICFLIGIGLGSLLLARHVPANRNVGLYFAALQAVTIVSILLLCAGIPRVAFILGIFGKPSDSLLPQHLQLLVVFVALFIPTVCSGASFPLLVKFVESRARGTGQALGSMYAANTVGSILGSLVTGFVLIPEFGSIGAVNFALACLGLTAALGGTLLSAGRRRLGGLVVGAVAILLLTFYQGYEVRILAFSGIQGNETFEQFWGRYQQRRDAITFFAEGRDATIAVMDSTDTLVLTINGLGQGGRGKLPPYHNLESLLVAMVPVAHSREPENALLVGLGAGTTLELLREFGVSSITAVELESRVPDAVRGLFGGESPLESEGIELVLDDARHYLLLGERRETDRYDIITSMPFHPWVASSLYTEEFFELARDNLTPEGIFSTWFGTGRMDAAAVQSLLRAFTAAFAHYVIYFVPETSSYFLVGSPTPIEISLDRIRELHRRPSVVDHEDLDDPYFLLARVFASGDSETPAAPEGVVNTDDTAFVEVHAPRSGRTSPILREFLPREYLAPRMVSVDERRDLFIELLEHLLGSPGGRFPLRQYSTYPERAAQTLAAASEVLSPDEVTYFEGRHALSLGQLDRARAKLTEASAGEGELVARAHRFRALTHGSGSEARRQALSELAPSVDAVVGLLDSDPELALERARRLDPASGGDEELAWFLRKAATTEPGALGEADRTRFGRRLGKRLSSSNRVGLLGLAVRFCREQGLEREAELFDLRRRGAAAARVRDLVVLANAAYRAGRFQEASESFWQAHRLEPGNESIMRPLLRSLFEAGDEERAAALIEDFRFLGRSERHLHALMEAVRQGEVSVGSGTADKVEARSGGPLSNESEARR